MTKLKLEAIREQIFKMIKVFQNRHLRLITVEDERLEFDVDQRWKTNKKLQNDEQKLKEKNECSDNTIIKSSEQVNFYALSLLFFSQMNNEPPIDLQILDTMFFLQDHSICFLYKDLKKGLIKVKQRGINACQTFIKRNIKKKENPFRDKMFIKSKSSIYGNEERSYKSLNTNLDYFALLKYKDSSFLRLKQSDVRSIFTNPLYANERFKHNNCTQYIQILPTQNSQEIKIQFSLSKFKNDPLMQAAKNMQLGKTGPYGDRLTFRKILKQINPTIFLYYTVFEIVSFVAIHYNKQIQSAHFHFVGQEDTWYLADAENVKIVTYKQKEFGRYELWTHTLPTQDDHRVKQMSIFQEKPEEKTLFVKTVENYFTQTNQKIKKDIVDFMTLQIQKVKKPEQQKLSKSIFQILHPRESSRYYQYLNYPYQMLSTNKVKKQNRGYSSVKQLQKYQFLKNQPRRTIRQQMMLRKQQKEQYIYRGIQS